jgi:hypothetical protein
VLSALGSVNRDHALACLEQLRDPSRFAAPFGLRYLPTGHPRISRTPTGAAPPGRNWSSSPSGRAAGGAWRTSPKVTIAADAYTIRCMPGLYEAEIEPEVRSWLASLSDRDFGRADFLVGLLAERPKTLVSHIPAISAARFGSCDFICCASRPGLPTGSPRGGG